MSKPIFVIRFPYSAEISDELFMENYKAVSKKLNDYHVLVMKDSFIENVTFECFNAPHTEMEFEELKRRVLELMK
jgi:hypothetical protein